MSPALDRIRDAARRDKGIQLENAVFAALTITGTLAAGDFVIGTAAQDASDRVIYNSGTGALLYDPDGTGTAAAVRFGTLNAGLALTNADFFVI